MGHRADGYVAAARNVLPLAAVLLPVPFTVYAIALVQSRGALAFDFHHGFWPAARAVLDGVSPYPAPDDPRVTGVTFPYPAPTALGLVPFGLLARDTADAVVTALDMLWVPLTLRVLGVRDWRPYLVVFLWGPVFSAWQSGNITTLLALAAACAWHWRDRPARAGVLVGLAVAGKPFLWPLGLWLLAGRRHAALAWAAGAWLAVNAVAWAVLGFGELGRYGDLVRAVTDAQELHSYSVYAFLSHLGAGSAVAHWTGWALAALACGACLVTGRRGAERPAFLLALGASLLASPIVWLHYFALLLIPVALARPRLSGAWGLPVVMIFCPATEPSPVEFLVVAVLSVVLFGLAMRRSSTRAGPMCEALDA